MTTDVFENTPAAEPVETLVGEGKKYATVEKALEALTHSQAHIQRIEEENRTFKAQVEASTKFEELVARFERPPAYVPPASEQAPPPVTPPAQEDLATLVREVTRQEREQESTRTNIESVGAKLIEVYGSRDKANEVVVAKAAELGVSVEFLQGVAAKSPKAFFSAVGLTQSPQGIPAFSEGSVNIPSSPLGTGKPGTYSYYQELRRTDPKAYMSPKIQLEMQNVGLKFGPGWVNT